MKHFYLQFIKNNELCFNVDANFGNRTDVFFSLRAKVISAEPQKDCCDYLKEKYNNKIKIINKALGEKVEQKSFYISYYSLSLSSLSVDWISDVKKYFYKDESWDRKETFDITTLDLLIEEFGTPSFIKIDVEVYELEVLKGLSTPINVIGFEYVIPKR